MPATYREAEFAAWDQADRGTIPRTLRREQARVALLEAKWGPGVVEMLLSGSLPPKPILVGRYILTVTE